MKTIHLDNDYEVNEFIIENLKKENKELKRRLENSIKFVLNRFKPSEHNQEIIFINNVLLNKLLDILKGEENE